MARALSKNDMPAHRAHDLHPTWSEPLDHWTERVHFGKVALIWMAAFALSTVLSLALGFGLAAVISGNQLDASDGGLYTIAGGFGTFLGFFIACVVGLRSVGNARFYNALAVVGLHLIVITGVVLANLVSEGVFGPSMVSFLPDTSKTFELGVSFFTVERSAATAVAGALLAAAMLPAMGPTPRGTQMGAPDDEHTL